MYVLLDLDHTIANSFWRDSMIGVNSWDEYHEASKDDKPFKIISRLVNSLAAMNYVIIGITGRNEKFRQLTTKWLLEHRIDVDELLMRPDGDFSKNGDVKTKLIENRFKGNYKLIQFLIDDNEDTIRIFQLLGITTLQVRNINEVKHGHDQSSISDAREVKNGNNQSNISDARETGQVGTNNGSGNFPESNGVNEAEQSDLQKLS
jgi:hypothetical protein